MSARIQNLSVLVVGALAVACTKPTTERASIQDQTPAGEVPTLSTAAPTDDQALVTPLETGMRSELKLVRPAEKKPPQQVAVKGKGDLPGERPGQTPSPSLDLGEVTPSVTAANHAPAADTPIQTAMAPAPHGPALGSDGNGAGVGQEPALAPERGMGGPGTIIIRGGMGGIEDDCKRHPNGIATPVYPGGGIAINNRMPPRMGGPVMASNPSQRPFTPGNMGGTGGVGVPRRGVIR